MTTVKVDGQGQNEKVCTSQQCHHQKINDGERLHEKVVTMVDLCLVYTTGYHIFSETLVWRARKLRNGCYN